MLDQSALQVENFQGHQYARKAAMWVSIMSGIFVLALLGYLFFSAYLQSQGNTFDPESSATIDRMRLELEYIHLKSERFGYALIYRFSLAAAGIIVSLATIVLGSVLILDRVKSDQQQQAVVEREGWTFRVMSNFPGLIMVFLGSATLALSIATSSTFAPRIAMVDVPMFISDENPVRNAMGIRSSMIINPDSSPKPISRMVVENKKIQGFTTDSDETELSQ